MPTNSAPSDPVIKHRTYDPETKTLKKHAGDDDVEMDTVENRVEGLAERIIQEDEERRAQDLVSTRLDLLRGSSGLMCS